jgi:hypothetical protein
MTIKQQGGVFGRNPTFNNVEVDGKLSGGDLRGDSLGVGVDSLSYQAEFAKAGSPSYIMVNTTGGSASGLLIGAEGTLNAIYSGTGPGNLAGKPLFLYQGFTLVCNTTAAGNLAFPSGQGIDFSATAGTGTSELFDDYEEGTWTPTIVGQSSGGTGTYTSQSGGYRKVGGMVQAWFQVGISAHTGAGVIDIEGFPFTSANDGLAQVGTAATLDMTYTAAGVPIVRMTANSAKANLQTIADGANWTSQSLATDTVFTIYGSICYKTA